MYEKEMAINEIISFLKSDEKGMLITGTHQYKKHYLIMALIEKYYKNAKILFRINAMNNITNKNFTPLTKKPKAGEFIKIGHNYYMFDAITSRATWGKTNEDFDFVIVYPIDSLCRNEKIEPIKELYEYRNIGKLFLCSWTDKDYYNYEMFSNYFTRQVIYDAEEEDLSYHNRVLGKE